MSLPLWKNLQRDQNDDRTIDDVINDKIDDHNDSTNAHLGSSGSGDRSLESHKTDDVLDHPAGSVVADKLTSQENVIRLNGQSTVPFSLEQGSIDLHSYGYRIKYNTSQLNGTNNKTGMPFWFPGMKTGVPAMLQFYMTTAGMRYDMNFAIAVGTLYPSEFNGFGVHVNKHDVTFFSDKAYTRYTSSSYDASGGTAHQMRMVYDPPNKQFLCYIDGDLKEKLDEGAGSYTDEGQFLNIYLDSNRNHNEATNFYDVLVAQGFHS